MTCNTPPDSRLWERHLADLRRLLAAAERRENHALVEAIRLLIAEHLEARRG
ncbi:MAG TPA: hypothetical protein VJN91_06690 [Gammaproteobacteria bacterium]|nr:hypothetical protein [Gammaproteobacteria bacterium]